MPANKPETSQTPAPDAHLEVWVPKIIDALKAGWADQLFVTPASQATPNLSDWLALIHAAATLPDELPRFLLQLLKLPKSATPPPGDWVLLTNLLNLTFEAAKTQTDQFTPDDWQSLVEIQHRILRAAAQISAHSPARPDTGTLARREAYLHSADAIDRLFATGQEYDDLLVGSLELLQKNFPYKYVSLYLLDTIRHTLKLQFAVWESVKFSPKDAILLELEQGIVGRVAATGQACQVNNTAEEPQFVAHPALPHVQSQLALPLLAHDTLLGVLSIECDRPLAFSDDDRTVFQALANHLALAIENIELRKAHIRHAKEQSLIYDTIVTLGAGSSVDKVLQRMSQKITLVMEAGACVICQIDEKINTITALTEYVLRHPGNPNHTWRPLNIPTPIAKDPIARQTLKVARPAISRAKKSSQDTTKNLVWRLPSDKNVDNRSRWNVVLAIPFELKSRITGLIEVYDKNPNRSFSPEDVQFCRILATQTAMAMEQARLFDETMQRLNEVSMLYTMAQKIASTLDLDDVLNTIATSVREVTGCRACAIFLLDESRQQLQIAAADGLKPQWRKMAKLKLGEGVAGRAAAEGRPIYIPDTSKDPTFIFFDEAVRSLMVVPLLAKGKVIGAINVDDDHPNAFGPEQERLLTIAATQVGISIENARLFTRVSAEQKQMQAVIQHMADGLLLIDKDGNIITCNSTLAMMLEMHRGQITGQNVKSANLPGNLAQVTASTTQQRARTGVLAQEITTAGKRPRTLQIFTTSLTDDDNHPVGEVRVVHDVTKERELEQLKDDFFSTISHELRTPLFSIQGFAQIMLEEADIDEETRVEFLNTIQRQATQLSEMVNNLLDISKFEDGKLLLERKPVSVLDVIHQTILKLQGYAHQKKVKLISDLSDPIPTVIGDAGRLEQVLTNLIGNAVKFSPAGESVQVSATLNDDKVIVKIKDNGIGIPAEALPNIFSRYYQVGNKSERSAMGTGLGLHIAKQIVDGHGGRIWAESKAGQGSLFCFTLPLPA